MSRLSPSLSTAAWLSIAILASAVLSFILLNGDSAADNANDIDRVRPQWQLLSLNQFLDPAKIAMKSPQHIVLDPHSVVNPRYDAVTILDDGTAFLFHNRDNKGPFNDCTAIVNEKERIRRIHWHSESCKVFDKMFGNRLGNIYGIKMIANALGIPFEYTCGLAEGESPNGAAYLMNLNSNNNGLGPPPDRNGEQYSADDICKKICHAAFCNWYDFELDLASDAMIADWKHITKPEFVPITDHDDAVIHLRLGDALKSTFGVNQNQGIFPHLTYINLLRQAIREQGPITSIGIVTAPFEGKHMRDLDKQQTVELSKLIANELRSVLAAYFPEATVRIHNSPNQTIMESLTRLVTARKVAICGCSTFCPYPVLATNGIGFVYNPVGPQNCWVRNAAKRYENFRLFDAPMLNGLMINNQKIGWKQNTSKVMKWVRQQDPNVGGIDIVESPMFRRSPQSP